MRELSVGVVDEVTAGVMRSGGPETRWSILWDLMIMHMLRDTGEFRTVLGPDVSSVLSFAVWAADTDLIYFQTRTERSQELTLIHVKVDLVSLSFLFFYCVA